MGKKNKSYFKTNQSKNYYDKAQYKRDKEKHRRYFRYSLNDIKIGNWYLQPTKTWWSYLGSFFR